MQTFKIRINDGPEQDLKIKTSIYRDAAAAVPAIYGLHLPVEVDIWALSTIDDSVLSRFRYRMREDEYGRFLVEHLVKVRQPVPNGVRQSEEGK